MKAVFIQEAFIRENYLRRIFALHLRMSLWKDLKTILLCTGPAFLIWKTIRLSTDIIFMTGCIRQALQRY